MKKKLSLIKFILVFLPITNLTAQVNQNEGNESEFSLNNSNKDCVSLEQRLEIQSILKQNVENLKIKGKIKVDKKTNNHILFEWPVKKANNSIYNNVWGISNYFDHNASYPNQVTDYNCGSRTYDTSSGYNHQGIDIFTWPFTWKQLDEGSAEIIAAAEGIIIGKTDGNYDRNCSFNSSNWNAVYVMHPDGSIAWYGHMKNGSLTTKNIGDTVDRGEILGKIGSSGNSTGPHLHFEVYTDNTYTQLVDPYQGDCNNLNFDSWWINQKPYKEPEINLVSTHHGTP